MDNKEHEYLKMVQREHDEVVKQYKRAEALQVENERLRDALESNMIHPEYISECKHEKHETVWRCLDCGRIR